MKNFKRAGYTLLFVIGLFAIVYAIVFFYNRSYLKTDTTVKYIPKAQYDKECATMTEAQRGYLCNRAGLSY